MSKPDKSQTPNEQTQTNQKSSDVKIATFKLKGGMVFIPYSDPATLERILQGVKMLREGENEESKEESR
jgi:hypothetical protein